MNTIEFLPSMTDITDEQLWQAIKPPARGSQVPGAAQLAQALKLANAGDLESAYKALGQYHRHSLANEWAYVQKSYHEAATPPETTIKNLMDHKITCWHTQTIQFDKKIDWYPEDTLKDDSLAGFHYHGWLSPLVISYVQSPEPAVGHALADFLEQYYFGIRQDCRWTPPQGPCHETIRSTGSQDQRYKNFVFHQLCIACKFPLFVASYLALLDNQLASPKLTEAIAKQALGYARAIGPQNRTFSAHNIQTHGFRVLLQIARWFPEYRESATWDRLAAQRLLDQLTRGYDEDGCQAERVWGYSSHTLRSLTQSYELGMRLGGLGKDEKSWLKGIRNAYQFYAKTAGPRPALTMPAYGDDGHNSTAHHLLKEGLSYFPQGTDENLNVDRTKSYCLKQAGFAIFRNGDDKRSTFMDLNFGNFAGWHSHHDLLSMNMFAYGEPVLSELIRFGPYGVPLDHVFRAPEAHNLVTIDGMVYNAQACKGGDDVAWYSDNQIDYFSATHRAYIYHCFGKTEGYPTSPNIEGLVRRTVLFVKDPGYAVVLDTVSDLSHPETFARAISQRWHGPKQFVATSATSVKTLGKGPGIAMAWAHPHTLQPFTLGTDFNLKQTEPFMAKGYERHHVIAHCWPPLSRAYGISGFATLLCPFAGQAPAVSIREVEGPSHSWWRAESYEVTLHDRTDLITLNPERVADLKALGQHKKARARVKLGNRKQAIFVQ